MLEYMSRPELPQVTRSPAAQRRRRGTGRPLPELLASSLSAYPTKTSKLRARLLTLGLVAATLWVAGRAGAQGAKVAGTTSRWWEDQRNH